MRHAEEWRDHQTDDPGGTRAPELTLPLTVHASEEDSDPVHHSSMVVELESESDLMAFLPSQSSQGSLTLIFISSL